MWIRCVIPAVGFLVLPCLAPAQAPAPALQNIRVFERALPAQPQPPSVPDSIASPWSPTRGSAAANLSDALLLRSVGLPATGPALVEFFRKRTQPPPAAATINVLINQLGDASPAVRQRAAGELAAMGSAALPALRN